MMLASTLRRYSLWLVLLSFFSSSFLMGEDPGPRVETFNPTGVVKDARQVTVVFSDAMIPMGDPRVVEEPFQIDCPEKGAGRWVDSTHWVYDFENDLPGGVRCEFRLKQTTQSLAGRDLAGAKTFIFSTGGPAVKDTKPHEGNESIVENQAFLLTLDAVVTPESIANHIYFQVEGITEPVGATVLTGDARKAILAARSRWEGKIKDENLVLIVQPKQNFPEGAKVTLIWGRGISSPAGVTTDEDQVLNFKVRGAFTANFSCQRENAEAGCIPFMGMSLELTSEIEAEDADKIELRDALGKVYRRWKPEGEAPEYVQNIRFEGPFPEDTEFTLSLPTGMKDDSGRLLANADRFPLKTHTERFPPLAKFSAPFGILESKGEALLPLTLRRIEPEVAATLMKLKDNAHARIKEEPPAANATPNEEKVEGRTLKVDTTNGNDVLYWLTRVDEANREKSVFKKEAKLSVQDFRIPRKEKPDTTEVVGIPFKDPGFYVVELESPLLGASLLAKSQTMYVPTAVLVTNLAVHFKWGRESSLAWVTALDTGKPVGGAAVSVKNCQGKEYWSGVSNESGIVKIDKLPARTDVPSCSNSRALDSGLLVTARLDDDFSFVHSSWDKGIESWRFQLPTDFYATQSTIAHTVFARTLLRAGETVNMKHLLRKHVMNGFQYVPKSKWPTTLLVEHAGTDQKYRFPLKWRSDGTAETEWKIPPEAKLGTYEVSMLESPEKTYGSSSGTFRVEEFRVPLMKAAVSPPQAPLVRPTEASVDINVSYLSGGGAANLPVKIRSQVQPKIFFNFDEYSDFEFGTGPVIEGKKKYEDDEPPADQTAAALYQHLALNLDKTGSARAVLKNLPKITRPADLLTELEFNDPNGEVQTVSKRIPLWPSKRLVGIKPDSWAVSKDDLKAQVALLDLEGKPVANESVHVDMYERKTYTHRKRIVGGFYGYEHWEETKKVGSLCDGTTDVRGIFVCSGKAPGSGNIILQAVAGDGENGEIKSQREVWVAGDGDWWFEVQDHDRMDLIPQKKQYEPGENATFQVRMPFRSATALVTVEREGVLDAFVTELSGKSPVVDVPVKGNFAPNIFVSVLAVRGRVGDVKPTALVDLGRPAYKLGVAEINVGWAAHALKTTVTPNQSVYKVREKAVVKVKVQRMDGSVPPRGSEVALAAVDEGLLELMPNSSWDLLEHMMGRRTYEVQTASAQMFIVGKRHFGIKGIPVGGGGGKNNTRELFDTLLFWKAHVPLNSKGEASVTVPLNDSVTGFRIVAIATGGVDLFGTGSASIKTTQDLMLLSGLSPVVREGDHFRSTFTVRNTTERAMSIEVSASATVLGKKIEKAVGPLLSQRVSVGPGEATEVFWDVVAPADAEAISYEVTAAETGGDATDHIKVSQKVGTTIPVRTLQATITALDKPQTVPVQKPVDAIEGRGGLRATLASSLVGGALNGVREYMEKYPYSCLEQRVSRAVSLSDAKAWKKIVDELPSYLDSNGLAKYFPVLDEGDPVLTAYLISISDEAGWKISDDIKNRMLDALRGFVAGTVRRRSVLPTADLTLRKLAALEAITRFDPDPKLFSSIAIQPNLWPTSAVLDWFNILQRLPDYGPGEEQIKDVEKILKTRLTFQGTTMTFSTEATDSLWWLMVSNDNNAVRLILSVLRRPNWNDDISRVVRGALSRQKRGSWDLTTANAWGTLAVKKFSEQFETTPVTGITSLTVEENREKIEWESISPVNDLKSESVTFPWPAGQSELTANHAGKGVPWLTVQSLAAVPLKKPLSSGYFVDKTLTAVEQKLKGKWSRGDIVRVKLKVKSQTDMTWVVVQDPIPAGATILGGGLGRDSALATKDEKNSSYLWPSFQERSFEAMRAYYEMMPKGEWSLEYTVRLNASGDFQLPPTRVEAMYYPESFGEIPNANIEVTP